jgi:hypothetical protein
VGVSELLPPKAQQGPRCKEASCRETQCVRVDERLVHLLRSENNYELSTLLIQDYELAILQATAVRIAKLSLIN